MQGQTATRPSGFCSRAIAAHLTRSGVKKALTPPSLVAEGGGCDGVLAGSRGRPRLLRMQGVHQVGAALCHCWAQACVACHETWLCGLLRALLLLGPVINLPVDQPVLETHVLERHSLVRGSGNGKARRGRAVHPPYPRPPPPPPPLTLVPLEMKQRTCYSSV